MIPISIFSDRGTRRLAILGCLSLLPAFAMGQSVLDVRTLTKFVDPLFNPLQQALQPTQVINGTPLYDISISQFQQQLHRDLPPTTLWGYNGSFPGPALEVESGSPIQIRWTNDLVDEQGAPLTEHLLPYDTTVHGAGPHLPRARTIAHIHGGISSEADDGFPEHWFTPDASAPANGMGGPAGNQLVTTHENRQRAAANWYHDHAMGITRLNVYAGMSGLYVIRDQEEANLGLPSGDFEVPLVIQDRSFYENGELFYPRGPGDLTTPGVGDPLQGLPDDFPSEASQVPSFYADANLVNGTIWPFMEVEPRKYRFRMVNGANTRSYDLVFEPQGGTDDPLVMHQIGTDGGLLTAPVERPSIQLAPSDRGDVVVDFSQYQPGETIRLRNQGPRTQSGTTDEVMEFRIVAPTAPDTSQVPDQLSTIERYRPEDAVRTRTLELDREFDEFGRMELLLDGLRWTDATTEIVRQGDIEIWEFVNRTGMEHPMHVHMEAFQVLNRTDRFGNPVPLEAHELGWEDTVAVGPHETVSIMVKYEQFTGKFVWHCHILEHEDLEMMRIFEIVPVPEPSPVWPACLGLTGLLARTRRRTAGMAHSGRG